MDALREIPRDPMGLYLTRPPQPWRISNLLAHPSAHRTPAAIMEADRRQPNHQNCHLSRMIARASSIISEPRLGSAASYAICSISRQVQKRPRVLMKVRIAQRIRPPRDLCQNTTRLFLEDSHLMGSRTSSPSRYWDFKTGKSDCCSYHPGRLPIRLGSPVDFHLGH